MSTTGYLPIVYIRGYAGTGVEGTVDDTFYGFNKGSTHIRVGPKGDPQFFAFESPLVRLMTDHDYCDVFEGRAQVVARDGTHDPKRTIWIYRYYDPTSKMFSWPGGVRLEIEEAAEELRELVDSVKRQTRADRVALVAHSMGGLIGRSLIQKIYPQHGEKAQDHIAKLFTYGTPHGGIHFALGGGVLEWIRDQVGWNNSDDFGCDRMYQYLTRDVDPGTEAPEEFQQNSIGDEFPVDRVFCVVGTNARDYDAAFGFSKGLVGSQSDGLVAIRHAYVKNAHRAYVHRSHSGRYGMVNSEEGYQNLQRFLFGDVKVAISLHGVAVPRRRNTFYQAETSVSIRGLPILMHEQKIAHYCPILLDESVGGRGCHLYTAFLNTAYSPSPGGPSRYALGVAVHAFRHEDNLFGFSEHIEQVPLWSDYLMVDLMPSDSGFQARCSWLSDQAEPSHPIPLRAGDGNAQQADVVLPGAAARALGSEAKIHFEASAWQ